MIGPHYRPQLTSVLSITHRATGVLLSVVGAPLMLWWIAAVAGFIAPMFLRRFLRKPQAVTD